MWVWFRRLRPWNSGRVKCTPGPIVCFETLPGKPEEIGGPEKLYLIEQFAFRVQESEVLLYTIFSDLNAFDFF